MNKFAALPLVCVSQQRKIYRLHETTTIGEFWNPPTWAHICQNGLLCDIQNNSALRLIHELTVDFSAHIHPSIYPCMHCSIPTTSVYANLLSIQGLSWVGGGDENMQMYKNPPNLNMCRQFEPAHDLLSPSWHIFSLKSVPPVAY